MRYALLVLVALALLTGCTAPAGQVIPTMTQANPAPTNAPATGVLPTETTGAPAPEPTGNAEPTMPPSGTGQWVAFVDEAGNLALVNSASKEARPITSDGTSMVNTANLQTYTIYSNPAWSSDGRLVAYQRSDHQVTPERLLIEDSLWVYDLQSAQSHALLEKQTITGFAWEPGTHRIAYTLMTEPGYFTARGQVDAALAKGVWVVDADGGQPSELVKPEHGFSVVRPVWSPDGRFISFEEVSMMEGRGTFAYYDVSAQTYNAWTKGIGGYSWSPDGERIAYDEQLYIANGTERIKVASRDGSGEQVLPALFERGYAFAPMFSPQGDLIAYTAEVGQIQPGEVSNNPYHLYVQPASGGAARDVASIERAGGPLWLADASAVILQVGPWDSGSIQLISLVDGSVTTLAKGIQPALQPSAS